MSQIHELKPISEPKRLKYKDENKFDDDEPREFKLIIPEYNIIVYRFLIRNLSINEDYFNGKYNIYDLSEYDIELSGKKLIKYCKCPLRMTNGDDSYSGGNSHVFIFEDQETKVIYLPYQYESTDNQTDTNRKIKVDLIDYDDVNTDIAYEIIGFTKDKIICALQTEDDDSKILGIDQPEKYMNTYSKFDQNSKICYIK